MASYIFSGGSFLPLAGNKVVNNGNLLTMQDSDKIIIAGVAYNLGDYSSLSYPDISLGDCYYIIGQYIYNNDGTTRINIADNEITKLNNEYGITKNGTFTNTVSCISHVGGPYKDFMRGVNVISIDHTTSYNTPFPGNLLCIGAITEDGEISITHTSYARTLNRPYKVRKSIFFRWSELNKELSDLEFNGTTYSRHTVSYEHYSEIFVGAEQDTQNDIKEGCLYIHYFGYYEYHAYWTDVATSFPINNTIEHFENDAYTKYGKCNYLSTNGSMAVIDGQLYRNTFFDSFSHIKSAKFEIIDDSSTWDWCEGIYKYQNSAYSWNFFPYAYALKDGKLYIGDDSYNYMLPMEQDKIWTNISDFYAPHEAEQIDKTTGEIYKYFVCIYGISEGNLYQIKGNTVTAVDSSGDWAKTWGQYDSSRKIYAFALRSNGHLYRIEDTTITDLGHING